MERWYFLTMLDNYIINEETLLYFIARDLELQHLESMGVDNWSGYAEGRKDFIKDVINDTQPEPIKIETIISEVANTYNVSETDILSNRRTASLARARQVAMYIARETTGLSFKQIGENFGKDHSTVLYNVRQVEDFIADKPYEKALVEDIIKNLKSNNS